MNTLQFRFTEYIPMLARLLASLIILFSSTVIVAGNSINGLDNKNNNKEARISKAKTDTTIYEVDEEEEEMIAMDEALFTTTIPADDFYGKWDTSIIHPYGFNKVPFLDTTTLILQNENHCEYVHPYVGAITSDFGPRRRRYHYGIDIKLEIGDTVACAFDGMVRIAKKNKTYGNLVVVRHNNGLETYYAHLSQINVEPGQTVHAGELLGLGGNTGRSSGSHLHFEVRFKGRPINPNQLICFKENKLLADTFNVNNKCFDYLKYYSSAKKPRYYTIRRGDTLSTIARRYKTTTRQLCRANGLKSTSVLRVGRKLKI